MGRLLPIFMVLGSSTLASAQDLIPPAQITQIKVAQLTTTSVRLTWTNVADDGNNALSGNTAILWIAVSDIGPIDDANWDQVSSRVGDNNNPKPKGPGTVQSWDITGLPSGRHYWFAIWAGDEDAYYRDGPDGGWNRVSPNVDLILKAELTPPAAVADLEAPAVSYAWATLTWTAPGDDADVGTAARYDLRMSRSSIATDADFSAATPVPGVPDPLRAGSPQTFTVSGLDLNTTYHFALKTTDEWDNWSGLSTLATATTLDDLQVPDSVTDLVVLSAENTSITLYLTVPHDNDRIARCDLRHSTAGPILTEADFDLATAVGGLPVPGAPGSGLMVVVDGLAEETSYYFAVKVADRKPNWSSRSNGPTIATLPGGSEGVGAPSCGASSAGSSWTAVFIIALLGALFRRSARRASAAFLLLMTCLGISEALNVVGSVIDVDPTENLSMQVNSNNVDVCYNAVEDEYFVVHTDADTFGNFMGVTGRRIDAATGLLVDDPIIIQPSARPGLLSHSTYDVSIAHDPGSNRYLVAYSISWAIPTIDARFLGRDGVPIGPDPITMEGGAAGSFTYANHPDIAFDGTKFLVAWEHGGIETGADIHGRFFDPVDLSGRTAFAVDDELTQSNNPSIAFLGGGAAGPNAYLVAYAENLSGVEPRTIQARIVKPDGRVLPAQAISTSPGNNDWPRIAANSSDKEWLIAWERNDLPGSWAGMGSLYFGAPLLSSSSIAFRRIKWVGESTVPQGDGERLIPNGGEIDVAAAVAWSDIDNQYVISRQVGALFSGSAGISGLRVAGGADFVMPGSDTVIAGDPRDEFTPVLAARTGTRELLSAWELQDNEAGNRVQAVRIDTIAPEALPGPSPLPVPSGGDPGSGGNSGGGCSGSAGAIASGLAAMLLIPAFFWNSRSRR